MTSWPFSFFEWRNVVTLALFIKREKHFFLAFLIYFYGVSKFLYKLLMVLFAISYCHGLRPLTTKKQARWELFESSAMREWQTNEKYKNISWTLMVNGSFFQWARESAWIVSSSGGHLLIVLNWRSKQMMNGCCCPDVINERFPFINWSTMRREKASNCFAFFSNKQFTHSAGWP